MFACCSDAAELDLALEPLGADAGGELGRQHLHDDLAAERGLVGDEDARHPAAAELALDGVGATERVLELVAKAHRTGVVLTLAASPACPTSAAAAPSSRDRPDAPRAASSLLHRGFELRIVAADHFLRRVLDVDVRRDALVLHRPLAVAREEAAARRDRRSAVDERRRIGGVHESAPRPLADERSDLAIA